MSLSRRNLILAAGASLCMPAIATAKTSTLKVRTTGRLPRSYFDPDKGWLGYEIDLTRAIAEEVDPKLILDFGGYFNWTRALKQLEFGELHVMHGLSYRPARAEVMDYIGATDVEDVYFVSRVDQDVPDLTDLDMIAAFDLPVQVNFGAAWNPSFDERLKTDTDYAARFANYTGNAYEKRSDFLGSTIQRIHFERVAGAILAYYTAGDAIASAADLGLDPADFKATRISAFGSAPTYVVTSRLVDAHSREGLKDGYQRIRQSGRFGEIWNTWYQGRAEPPNIPPGEA